MSKSVYEILEEVASTTSKNEKERILNQHKDNVLLKECFRLAYSPTINFWTKKIDLKPSLENALGTLESALPLLSNIYERVYTGNEAKQYLDQLLFTTKQKDREVLEKVVLKDLRCGVQGTTINKIWKGLIPKVPQMLASSMKESSLAKIKYPCVAELKSDGSRCIAYCSTDGVKLMSRNGKQYQGLKNLEKNLQDSYFNGLVLDGELVFDTTKADRTTGNGIVTKAVKGTISEKEQANVIFQVWDVLPMDKYVEKGVVKVPQSTRYEGLATLLRMTNKDNIQLIPSTKVNNLAEARKVFQDYVDKGFEGIILKNTDGYWADKRSPDLVKFKEELFADLKVVGYFEGQGKISGMLGGLSLETEDGVIGTNLGSGFSEQQRKELWNNRDNLIGEIVEVKYNGLTEDKRTGKKSLFLPIFQRFREDKSEANTFDEMQ